MNVPEAYSFHPAIAENGLDGSRLARGGDPLGALGGLHEPNRGQVVALGQSCTRGVRTRNAGTREEKRRAEEHVACNSEAFATCERDLEMRNGLSNGAASSRRLDKYSGVRKLKDAGDTRSVMTDFSSKNAAV